EKIHRCCHQQSKQATSSPSETRSTARAQAEWPQGQQTTSKLSPLSCLCFSTLVFQNIYIAFVIPLSTPKSAATTKGGLISSTVEEILAAAETTSVEVKRASTAIVTSLPLSTVAVTTLTTVTTSTAGASSVAKAGVSSVTTTTGASSETKTAGPAWATTTAGAAWATTTAGAAAATTVGVPLEEVGTNRAVKVTLISTSPPAAKELIRAIEAETKANRRTKEATSPKA
ncbi:hypothetical protein M758_UG284300, partial [Ceratodon purpureus]